MFFIGRRQRNGTAEHSAAQDEQQPPPPQEHDTELPPPEDNEVHAITNCHQVGIIIAGEGEAVVGPRLVAGHRRHHRRQWLIRRGWAIVSDHNTVITFFNFL